MANKLILKRSSVASKVPLATDLEPGELAVNLTDQKLYSKKTDGTVILVGSGLGGAGDVQGPASATANAPALFDGTTGKLLKNASAGYGDTVNPYGSKTANQFLAAPDGSNGSPAFRALANADLAGISKPTITVYESGSGTYTVPSGCRYLLIEAIGGGGGGGGSGGSTSAGSGANGGGGGNTTINSTLIVAYGGAGGAGGEGSIGMNGGVGGTAAGTANILVNGQRGTANGRYNTGDAGFTGGGIGGACAFGKSGGDGGGANATSVVRGAGGGGGAYCASLVTSPAASYTYSVGAGGTGGAAGTNGGVAGEAGRAGMVIFTAFFA